MTVISYRSGVFALFLGLNTLLILNLLGFQAQGPDIENYLKFTTDTSVVVRIPFAFFLSLLPEFLTASTLGTLYWALLHFIIKPRNKGDILLITVYFSGLMILSYSANSLVGNLLRQALATIIIAFFLSQSFSKKLISLGFASVFHIASIPVLFLLDFLRQAYRSTQIILLLVFCCAALVVLFYLLPNRILVVLNRDTSADILGFIFVAFLFNMRLILLIRFGSLSLAKYILTSIGVLLLAFLGEFGQRILISSVFIIDLILLQSNYRSKSFFIYIFVFWSLESYFRYAIVGNFWGIQ